MSTVPQPPIQTVQYARPRVSPRAAARRAGILMVGIGIVLVLFGGVVALIGFSLSSLQIPADMTARLKELETQTHLSAQSVFLGYGAIFGGIGFYQVIMGAFVIRGGKRTLSTAVVIHSILSTFWLLSSIGSFVTGSTDIAAGAGLLLISLCLMGWQLAWLLQALHAARNGPQLPSFTIPLAPSAGYPPQPPGPNPIGWPYPPPPSTSSINAAIT